jgi:hypothetical protein
MIKGNQLYEEEKKNMSRRKYNKYFKISCVRPVLSQQFTYFILMLLLFIVQYNIQNANIYPCVRIKETEAW